MQSHLFLIAAALCLSLVHADYPVSVQTGSSSSSSSSSSNDNMDSSLATQLTTQDQSSALAIPPPHPFMMYGSQDPVQQYVANYGGASLPVAYGYGPEAGYGVQTGIEGYLVPATYDAPAPAKTDNSPMRFLSAFPRIFVDVMSRAGMYLLGSAGFLLLGGAFTTAMCTLTPFCTISFLGLGLAKESVRSFITPDNLTAATLFLKEAVDRYQNMQKVKNHKK